MKAKQYILLSIFLVRGAPAFSQDSLSNSTLDKEFNTSRPCLMLLYDPTSRERAGSEDVYAIHSGISWAEDAIIGTHWFPENTFVEKAGAIFLRSAKYAFLDLPLDGYSFVFTHEYFGHGMRFRELSDSEIKYHLDMPPPYGQGGGHAYSVDNIPLSYHGCLAIFEGGIESQMVLNKAIAMNWMKTNEMHYRDAALYLFSFLNYYTGTVRTKKNYP